jgi:hypothetical protein
MMLKKIALSIVMFSVAVPALGQGVDNAPAAQRPLQVTAPRPTLKPVQAQINKEAQQQRKDALEKFKDEQRKARELFRENQDVARKDFEARRKAAQSELKTKLAAFKDQAKARIVSNLDEEFNNINARITAKMTTRVEKIETVLGKIGTRTEAEAVAGKDVVAVRAAIAVATTAIADARAAITVQTAKTYTITMTDEDKAKEAAKTTRALLKADVDVAEAKIKIAHDKVRLAAQALEVVIGQQ